MPNWRSVLITGALLMLAACAGHHRSAPEAAPAPPPPVVDEAPVETAPSVVAPGVSVTPPPAPQVARRPGDVVVPGQAPIPVPSGDNRTVEQRRQDTARWDRCVMASQSAAEDPTRPELETPEERCRRMLSMANRNAPPTNRR
jgi:hypothetical protein